jgi:copper resistance protein C
MIQWRKPRRRQFMLGAVAMALAGLFWPARPAAAHAIIVSSKPARNDKVALGPVDVVLQFNSRIDISLSRVSLVDPVGKVSALSIASGSAPGSLVARATTDAIGPWKLRWQVLSVDGHITRGEIPFLVVAKTAP